MDHIALNPSLNCQAITDLLCRRFEIQHGCELVPIVGLGNELSNQSAVLGWVRRRVDFYQERGVDQPLLYLEAELARRLADSPYFCGEFSDEICITVPDLPEPPERDGLQLIQGDGREETDPRRTRPDLSLVPGSLDDNKGD